MQKFNEMIPQWFYEDNLCLSLSNDIDSLMSCYYLTKYKGWDIQYFYDFDRLYRNIDFEPTENNCIGVDVDLLEGRCIGNHLVNNSNKNCINLNRFARVDNTNYYHKYAGSTILMVLSLLNIDINTFTEEQQEILLCVDTTFKSYFFDENIAAYYIQDVLGYPELIAILKKHSKEYFYDIMSKYKLFEKINMSNDGYLQTNIMLEELNEVFNIELQLPKSQHGIIREFLQGKGKPAENMNVFSLAWTYKNNSIFSYYID